MNIHHTLCIARLIAATTIGLSPAMAANNQPEPVAAPLSEAGSKLEAKFAATLAAMRKEIAKSLPEIDGSQQASFLKVYQDEAAATVDERKSMQAQAKSKDKEGAAKAYATAKEALALATTNAQAPAKAVLTHLDKFLTSDNLDAQLVKCAVLFHATEHVDIAAPYTIGKWDKTPPVEISLVKGRNVLRFSRPEPVKGMTIKDFTLTPVK